MKQSSPLSQPPDAGAPCLYCVDVTPARRGFTPGWRVQVFDIDGHAHLTESALPWRMLGLWRATEEGALHVGISEAFELRSDAGLTGPLVVYAAGVMIVDERPAGSAADARDDLVSYGLALHAVRIATGEAREVLERDTDPGPDAHQFALERLCGAIDEALEGVR